MKKLIFLFIFLYSYNSYALSGNELYSMMTSNDMHEKLEAIRYIEGVIDTEKAFWVVQMTNKHDENSKPNYEGMVCPPDNYTLQQVQDIVKIYIEKNPAYRQLGAATHAHYALLLAWPCTE